MSKTTYIIEFDSGDAHFNYSYITPDVESNTTCFYEEVTKHTYETGLRSFMVERRDKKTLDPMYLFRHVLIDGSKVVGTTRDTNDEVLSFDITLHVLQNAQIYFEHEASDHIANPEHLFFYHDISLVQMHSGAVWTTRIPKLSPNFPGNMSPADVEEDATLGHMYVDENNYKFWVKRLRAIPAPAPAPVNVTIVGKRIGRSDSDSSSESDAKERKLKSNSSSSEEEEEEEEGEEDQS